MANDPKKAPTKQTTSVSKTVISLAIFVALLAVGIGFTVGGVFVPNIGTLSTSRVVTNQVIKQADSAIEPDSGADVEKERFRFDPGETMEDSKTSWPDLIGVDGEQAKITIQSENPSLQQVTILPEDAVVTMDYREDRVRIFVDKEGKVAKTPIVG